MSKKTPRSHTVSQHASKQTPGSGWANKQDGASKGRSNFDKFMELANSGTRESQREGFRTMQQATRHR